MLRELIATLRILSQPIVISFTRETNSQSNGSLMRQTIGENIIARSIETKIASIAETWRSILAQDNSLALGRQRRGGAVGFKLFYPHARARATTAKFLQSRRILAAA